MDGKLHKMFEATRLTCEGRLNEATLVIKRHLGLGHRLLTHASDPELIEEKFRLTAKSAKVPDTLTGAGMPRHAEEVRPIAAERPIKGATTARRTPILNRPLVRPSLPGMRLPGGPLPGMPLGRPGRPLQPPAPAEGQWLAANYANSAGIRAYKLYVPSGHHGQPMPLVVMLHGCTQDPDDFAVGTRMNFLAEEMGFLVAYPAQAGNANVSKCWNWFQPAHQERDQGEPSLIAGITRQVMAGYQVDGRRVYVAGLSAGGAMAAIMATTYPDLYMAVGVHSGLAAGAAHDLPSAIAAMQKGGQSGQLVSGHTIPLILFHGDRDATVHPANADDLLRQRLTGKPVAADMAAPSVTKSQGRVADGRAYTCETYRDTSGQVVAEQWTIHGAGHSWSGGDGNGSYTDPVGPDASREMARFFQNCP